MASPGPQTPEELIQDKLQEILAKQKWWQKSSNTVTAAFSGLVTLIWWVTSTGVALPDTVTYPVAIVLYLGTVLGIKGTKNGLTPSVANTITTEVSKTITTMGRHAKPDGQ